MADEDLRPKPEVSTVMLEHNGVTFHAVELRVPSRTTVLSPNMVLNLIAELATTNLLAQELTHDDWRKRAQQNSE